MNSAYYYFRFVNSARYNCFFVCFATLLRISFHLQTFNVVGFDLLFHLLFKHEQLFYLFTRLSSLKIQIVLLRIDQVQWSQSKLEQDPNIL